MNYSKNIFTFFKETYAPHLERNGRVRSTITSYKRAIKELKQWLKSTGTKKADANFKVLDRQRLTAFRDDVCSSNGNKTANRRIRLIKSVIRYAFDLDLVKSVPSIRTLDEVKAINKLTLRFLREPGEDIERDELSKLYLAASEMDRWPQIENAADYWKSMVVLYSTYGFRTNELVAIESGKVGLDWSNIHFDKEVRGYTQAESEFGWIIYTPQKQQRFKPHPVCAPLTESARKHLEALPTKTGPVFPFPKSKETFYQCWRDLFSSVGLCDGFKVKHLRKTAITWIDFFFAGCGELITGHAERGVSGQHYNQQQFKLVRAIENLPTPYAWA